MAEMVRTVRKEGPSGLYWGFLPHCFEAWPHDVSELLVYGHMKDWHASQQGQGQQQQGQEREQLDHDPALARDHVWMSSMPVHLWDLTTGAASGAAAVLVSMPFDCVKTYMQTHGTDVAGKGMLGGAALFLKTGELMVRRNGLASLYMGVVPRLLQHVPSATLCWWAINTFERCVGGRGGRGGGRAGRLV